MKRALVITTVALLAASPAFAQTAPTPYKVDLTPESAVKSLNLLQADVMAHGLEACKVDLPIADQIIAAGNAAKAADEAAKIKAAVDAAK